MAHRDPSKRPDRAQLRRALGLTAGEPQLEGLPTVDEQTSFEQQALITLLEVAGEIRSRLDQLEEAQLQTAETIGALGSWLQRNTTTPEQQPDLSAELAELRDDITKRAEELLEAIRHRPGLAPVALHRRTDVSSVPQDSRRIAVVPALREVLSVTRELQARLDAVDASSDLEPNEMHGAGGNSV